MMNNAVIFDMDGTLWDTSEPVVACWNEVGKKIFGPSFNLTKEDVQGNMGKQMDQILEAVVPNNVTKEQIERFNIEFQAYEVSYIQDGHPGSLYPNEERCFEELRKLGFKILIVSNCQSGYIQTYLKAYPNLAEYVSDCLCWGDTGLPKRGSIKEIMRRNGIDSAIYVGDTIYDEIEANGAKIPFVHAAYGFGTALSPDDVIYDLSELPKIAKKHLG